MEPDERELVFGLPGQKLDQFVLAVYLFRVRSEVSAFNPCFSSILFFNRLSYEISLGLSLELLIHGLYMTSLDPARAIVSHLYFLNLLQIN